MPRQDAQLTLDSGQHHHGDVVVVDLAVGRDDLDMHGVLVGHERL